MNQLSGKSPLTEAIEDGGSSDPRRQKLEKIISLGHDPYGQRFDNRDWIQDIREKQSEIKFVAADGQEKSLPDESEVPAAELRNWIAEQGEGQMIGPSVRAAGRIMPLMPDLADA